MANPILLQSFEIHLLNPNLSLALLLLGIFLIYLDFNIPGRVLPLCLGTLAVAFALNALRHIAAPVPAALAILTALLLPATLNLPRPLQPASAILLTLLLIAALLHLAPTVHLAAALLVALLYAAVTLKLAAIALLARQNKRIR